METIFDAIGVRRPSLRPLLGGQIPGKKHRWLKVTGIAVLTLLCFTSLHVFSNSRSMAYTVDLAQFAAELSRTTIQATSTASSLELTEVKQAPLTDESCESIKDRAEQMPDIDYRHPADLISDVKLAGWEDDWIAHGVIKNDSRIDPYKLDFVYTYVRSDQDFLDMKKPFDIANAKSVDLKWQILQASRFRSWDELRYSIRGSLKNAASWIARINIVAKDFERFDVEKNETTHVVQTPFWLNETTLKESSAIAVIPETLVLKNGNCGPTFNSVSLESSFGNVPLTTEHFIGMSDDMLLGKETSATDFVSPLFGMSFSWYHGFWDVNELKDPDLNDGELGEGHAVRHTSFLLNGRFGERPRTLQLHHAKVINQRILNEAMATFPKSALRTPLSRWRDDSHQLYSWYLHMHFTMEMHREALLWSIAMRIDANEDGDFQPHERTQFRQEIEDGIRGNGRRHAMPMLGQMQQKLRDAGLDTYRIQTLDHTSLDGPQQIKHLTFERCSQVFSVEKCFGPDFANDSKTMSMNSFFERLVSPEASVECGDCLIKFLLNNANLGLSSLLPRPGTRYREKAIKAIHKYQYTETSPDNAFLMVRNVADAAALPSYAAIAPGLMCINDDVTTMNPHELASIARGYHDFYSRLFPEPSFLENIVSVEEVDADLEPESEEPQAQSRVGFPSS